MMAKCLFRLQNVTPHTATFGTEGDISNICNFGCYVWVCFRDGSQDFPMMHECIGRCLGPTRNEGNEMTQWVLNMNGQALPMGTLRWLHPTELTHSNEVEARKRYEYDATIKSELCDSFTLPAKPANIDGNPQPTGHRQFRTIQG